MEACEYCHYDPDWTPEDCAVCDGKSIDPEFLAAEQQKKNGRRRRTEEE